MDKLLEQLAKLVESGVLLMDKELPLVAQQIIAYDLEVLWLWLWAAIPILLLFAISAYILYSIGKKKDEKISYDATGWFFFSCICSSFVLCMTLIMPFAAYDSYKAGLKIKTAPKLYLIERVLKLYK